MVTWQILYQTVDKGYNIDEIKTMIFTLYPEMYEEPSWNLGKQTVVIQCVNWLVEADKLEELLTYIKETRLHLYNTYIKV